MDIGRISPIAVVKVALERKLYGGCIDSFVGVVMEPCSIDVLHHLNYFRLKQKTKKSNKQCQNLRWHVYRVVAGSSQLAVNLILLFLDYLNLLLWITNTAEKPLELSNKQIT